MIDLGALSTRPGYHDGGSLALADGESKAVRLRPAVRWAIQYALGSGASLRIDITAADPATVGDDGAGGTWEPLDAAYTASGYVVSDYVVSGVRLTAIGGAVSATLLGGGS